MAPNDDTVGEARRSWPAHSSENVKITIAALQILREQNPDTEEFVAVRHRLAMADQMLLDYLEACHTAEAQARQKHETSLIQLGQTTERRSMDEEIQAAVNAATKRQLAELTEIARRHVRLTSRRRRAKAKKGGKGRG